MAVCLIWPMLAVYAHTSNLPLVADLLTWEHAPCFCAGMMLYLIKRDGHTFTGWLLVFYSWAMTVGITARLLPDRRGRASPDAERPLTVEIAAIALAFVLVGVLLLVSGGPYSMAPAHRSAGAITYPLYLIHESWGFLHPCGARGAR